MVEESRPLWVRYLASFAVVAAAALVRELLLQICPERFPFLAFFPAVVAVTLFFGRGPGLLSVALSIVTVWYWKVLPASPAPSEWANLVPLSMVCLAGLLLVLICDRSRIANRTTIAAKAAELEASQKLSTVLVNITGFFFVMDHDWRFTYVTQQTAKYFGREPSEIVGRKYAEICPTAERSEFANRYRQAIATQTPVEFETMSLAHADR